MTREATELLEKALKLPPKARAALIASLIESLDDPSDESVEAAWQAEIDRRARELDKGDVKLVPWAEARRQILDG
jgi:putative addiction module component (TIGR02574 family)